MRSRYIENTNLINHGCGYGYDYDHDYPDFDGSAYTAVSFIHPGDLMNNIYAKEQLAEALKKVNRISIQRNYKKLCGPIMDFEYGITQSIIGGFDYQLLKNKPSSRDIYKRAADIVVSLDEMSGNEFTDDELVVLATLGSVIFNEYTVTKLDFYDTDFKKIKDVVSDDLVIPKYAWAISDPDKKMIYMFQTTKPSKLKKLKQAISELYFRCWDDAYVNTEIEKIF